MRPTDIRLPGAVDLSGLKARAQAGNGDGAAAATSEFVIDVTEATFQAEVMERSLRVPVLLDFWATWCGPCKQLSPVLERLAAEANGAWVLAKIDVDANQRLGAAFQVQSIPAVFAVIQGQPMGLFQGALPEQQVRQVLDEVLRVAAEGLPAAGAPANDGGAEPAAAAIDPLAIDAQEALNRGDIDGAARAYRQLLERNPADPDVKAALASVELLARTKGADDAALRQRAEQQPDDVGAQAAVADLDIVLGHVDAAIERMVDVVRRSGGEQRDAARQHLLTLFEVLDPDDPRLAAGRRALANALF